MTDARVAQSVHQRLLNAAQRIGISHDLLMRRYVFERLLARVGASRHAGDLCLKGAMSFLAVTGDLRRPTKDMDFLGRSLAPAEEVLATFREIAALAPTAEDGIAFRPEGFDVEPIMGGADQPGVRVNGYAHLGNARVRLKLEIAFGDVLTPGAVAMRYPTVLDGFEGPAILVVSKETMLAEKFEAVCSLGERNTRFKDFQDIRGLSRLVTLDGALASGAMRATFAHRGTALPVEDPEAFRPGYAQTGQRGWSAYLRKQGQRDPQTFEALVAEIRPLVMGLAERARTGRPGGTWLPGTGWTDAPAPEADGRSFVPF